jgi:hypothetical protein
MRISKILFLFLAFNLAAFSTFSQVAQQQRQLSEERLGRYDTFLQKEVDEGRIAGAVTLIYKNGAKAHESTIGYSNLESKS